MGQVIDLAVAREERARAAHLRNGDPAAALLLAWVYAPLAFWVSFFAGPREVLRFPPPASRRDR
jgi:hypothetical protein